MSYWIKINYERKEYVIDLDRVSAFTYEPNGKLTFWLPGTVIPIILNPQSYPRDHKQVLTYIQEVRDQVFDSYWVKIHYDRKDYWINLKSISTFSCDPSNGKIMFWLPDGHDTIVIHPTSNPNDHQKILDYIKQVTGYSFP